MKMRTTTIGLYDDDDGKELFLKVASIFIRKIVTQLNGNDDEQKMQALLYFYHKKA